jgi:hypothetical protein
MISENALADLFEKAVRDLDPAVNVILLRAEQRGRRRRARRRLGMALGSGLVVLALAGTAASMPLVHLSALFPSGAAHHKLTGKHARTHHPRPRPTRHHSSPTQAGPPKPAGVLPGLAPGYQTTAEQKLAVLRRLLPAGATMSNLYPSDDGNLQVDYNDGQGAVDIQLSVDPTATFARLYCPTPPWPNETPRPSGALPVSCRMRTLPDGSIERDVVSSTDAYGWYVFSVYDQRPDGVTVDLEVGNGILNPLPQAGRARPPGTLAEWEAIAENPVWQLKKGWSLVG